MKTNQSQKNISSNWRQVKLGDICDILSGGTPDTTNPGFWNGKINWITPTEITRTGKYINLETEKKITELGLKNSSARLLPKGSLVVCTRATVGECSISTYPISTNQGFKNLIPKKDTTVDYLYYFVKSIKPRLTKLGSGSTFIEVSKGDIEKIKLNLPALLEQNRIVSVLETWDRSIEKLTQKIEIKKQIKKGLMQDLLTGKKRLAGFKDKWEIRNLGELCDIGTGKKNNQDKIEDGAYPFFVRSPFVERINSYSYDGEAILIPGEGNIGKIFHYINGKFDFHQRVYKISDFKKGVSGKYVYFYLFKNFSKATKSDSVKATVDSLRLPTFTNFKINLPSFREQEIIVNVLTTADKEIAELEKKLFIIKEQKRYLLNNLITGTIRTPETLSTKK